MIINRIRTFAIASILAFSAATGSAQDLLARQAPVDRRKRCRRHHRSSISFAIVRRWRIRLPTSTPHGRTATPTRQHRCPTFTASTSEVSACPPRAASSRATSDAAGAAGTRDWTLRCTSATPSARLSQARFASSTTRPAAMASTSSFVITTVLRPSTAICRNR